MNMPVSIEGISQPSLQIDPTKAKATTFAEFQQQQLRNAADNEYNQKVSAIYSKVGIQANPYNSLQIVIMLLIDANESIFDFLKGAGETKMKQTIQSTIGYLQYCGIQIVTANEQCLIQQLIQQTYDQFSLKGCARVAKELFDDTKRCMQKKAQKQ